MSARDTAVKIDLDQIRDLLSVVSKTDITELTIESGDQKITIKKAQAQAAPVSIEVPVAAGAAAPAQQQAAVKTVPPEQSATPVRNGDKSEANGLIPITSPMVGTFYRAANPTAPPFVEVGDTITPGQTVCIIEAMKLMNDLPAEIGGRIVKILVENGTTVEYGQHLFLVDPKG